VWAAGLAITVPLLIYLIVIGARAVFSRDYGTARRLIGTETFAQEEVDQAVALVDREAESGR
jgi:hypothetical protein